MSKPIAVSAADIQAAKSANPKLREVDLARHLGISECEYLGILASQDGSIQRLNVELDEFFPALEAAGQVMALSRNSGAVHEKTGPYKGYRSGGHASSIFGGVIDLRIFPKFWKYAFHVIKEREEAPALKSFQFFDQHGAAVHKIYAREETNTEAWDTILRTFTPQEKLPGLAIEALKPSPAAKTLTAEKIEQLRDAWSKLEDTHQFQSMLRKLKIERLDAIRAVGAPYATELKQNEIETLFKALSDNQIPCMVFARNRGILQIHSGEIENIKSMGKWLNVLDPGFHLHVDSTAIDTVWLVQKPTKRATILSIEIFDREGNQILLLNGLRREGDSSATLEQWNTLLSTLAQK